MLVRDFSSYEWEEEVQKLELPHFYLGKYYTFTLETQSVIILFHIKLSYF